MMSEIEDGALAVPARKAPEAEAVPPHRVGQPSRKAVLSGRVLSGLVVLFLAVDAAMKVVRLPVVVRGTVELGFPEHVVPWIGLVLAASLALHLVRRTSLLGAVLLTGYLGGAVATHLRHGDPLWSHTLFPVYVGALLWLGLWLRDRRARTLL